MSGTMLPASRPQMSAAAVLKHVQSAYDSILASMLRYAAAGRLPEAEARAYALEAAKPNWVPPAVFVVGMRGYYEDSMGLQDQNDRGIYDDAFFLFGPNFFRSFNGNTDPRLVKAGRALLLPGWHEFKQGWHGYGNPAGHMAFRTANAKEQLPVLRDGQVGIKMGHTINFHRGGINNTNSAGCQTVPPAQWPEFKKAAYELMDKEGQRTLPYLLLEVSA